MEQDQTIKELDIRVLLHSLWAGKYLITSLAILFFVISLIYSLTHPNIYRSEALLLPKESASVSNNSIQNSLLAFSGFQLGSQKIINQSDEALRRIKTFKFFSENLLERIKLEDIIAVKSWDQKSLKLNYDPSIYDENEKLWVGDNDRLSFERQQSAHKKFINGDHLNIFIDPVHGFVEISMDHESPYIAKEWLEELIVLINQLYRNEDKALALRSISYLNQQLSETSFTEIKAALTELMQKEIEKLTLIEETNEYVFKVMDPPIVSESKIKPNRKFIAILASLLGFFIGCLISLVIYSRR